MPLSSPIAASSTGDAVSDNDMTGGASPREPRKNLFLGATLQVPGAGQRAVRVRNLSASGARVECADPPSRGTTLFLCRGSVMVAAEVAWVAAASCGLRFAEPVEVGQWTSDRPQVVASIVEPTLAADLALAHQLLDQFADTLASRSELTALAGAELQLLDVLSQMLQSAARRADGAAAPEMKRLRQLAASFAKELIGAAA